MSEILVVGGAGYIGSHVIIELMNKNKQIVVLDDLSTGSKKAVLGGIFYQGCMPDKKLLDEIFTNHNITSVMLFAGSIDVNESVLNPSKYYNKCF
jgi:UDP-glucose 4-epimerase